MRHGLLAAAIGLALATPALAQTPPAAATATQPAPAPAPRPADVASSDAIVAALYQVISGDKDVPRDWDRFRSLFHPSGRLVAIGGPAGGPAVARPLTPDDYITRSGPLLLQGFHEREIARRVEHFGGLTHVFSTYDARRAAADATPFLRGINSIQLFDDGQRWWIVSVYWQSETPQFPLPAQYLPPAS
jgi:hypothetical protein